MWKYAGFQRSLEGLVLIPADGWPENNAAWLLDDLSPSMVYPRSESTSGNELVSSGMATVPESLTRIMVSGINLKVLAMLLTVTWSLCTAAFDLRSSDRHIYPLLQHGKIPWAHVGDLLLYVDVHLCLLRL